MWFDEEINLVIETDPFVNVSGATSFSQIDNVTAHITEQPIIISLSENYAPVQSVNGQIGFVVITKESLGITGGLVTSGDLSNYVTKINGEFSNRPTVNGTGILLSGEVGNLPDIVVYTTGNQNISGQKRFIEDDIILKNTLSPLLSDPSIFIGSHPGGGSYYFHKKSEYRNVVYPNPNFYYSAVNNTGVQIYFNTGESRWNFIYNNTILDKSEIIEKQFGSTKLPLTNWSGKYTKIYPIYSHNISHYTDGTDPIDPHLIGAVSLNGDQFISGQKIFLIQPNKSFWVDSENLDSSHGWLYIDQDYSSIGYHNNAISFNDSDIQVYGITNFDNFPTVNGTQLITGVDLSAYATTSNLELTGSTLQTNINNLSITYATISNLATTGSTLQTNIDSLSGVAVLIYGNQIISGTKRFNEDVYIKNLYVTGTEAIVNTTNFNVQSPYLILNLTGGAVDGGIFFVTGSGLTGINDYGPIIGFDHSKNFKFGVARRSDDLSTLNDIAAIQDITNYSGFVDNKYYPRSNPSGYVTKSNGQFDDRPTVNGTGILLSGEAAQLPDTIVYTTGNNVISGDNTFYGDQYIFSGADIIVSGGTFNLDIRPVVNGTGVLLSGEAAQLPETIVYTTNDQSITGLKTFRSGIRIGDASQISPPTIQIYDGANGGYSTFSLNDSLLDIKNLNRTLNYDFTKYLTGTTQTIAVIKDIENYTGFATTTNLASTGSTLDTKINDLSGNSVLVFGNQTISGQKRFVEDDITSNFPVSLIKGGFSGPGIYNFIQRPEYRTIVFPNPIYYYSGIGLTGVEIYFNTGTSRWWFITNNILHDASPRVIPSNLSANLPLNNWSGGSMRIQPIYSHNISHYTDGTDPIDPHLIGAVALTGNQTISGIKNFIKNVIISGETGLAASLYFGNTLGNAGRIYSSDMVNGPLYIEGNNNGIVLDSPRIKAFSTQTPNTLAKITCNEDLQVGPTANNRTLFLQSFGVNPVSISGHYLNLVFNSGSITGININNTWANTGINYTGIRYNINLFTGASGLIPNTTNTLFNTAVNNTGVFNINSKGQILVQQLAGSTIYDNTFEIKRGSTSFFTVRDDGVVNIPVGNGLAVAGSPNAAIRNGVITVGNGGYFGIGNTSDAYNYPNEHTVRLYRGGDFILDLRNATYPTSGHQFRVFNITGTNSGEYGIFGWQVTGIVTGTGVGGIAVTGNAPNALVIGTQATQSGTLRDLIITGSDIYLNPSGRLIINSLNPTGRNLPALSINNLWNDSTRLFTGVLIDITDSGSSLNSHYLNIRNNGTNVFTVRRSSASLFTDLLSNTYGFRFGTNAGTIGFTLRPQFDLAGFSTNTSLVWGSDVANLNYDLILARDAANTLAQRNGTNAQQFRVYNLTGTNTGEFGLVGWQNNNFIVGAQRTQNGTLRDLTLTGANVNIASSGIIISNPTVPTSTGSAGTRGQISWDNDFIYVCVSGNSWKRSALTTW